MSDLSPIYLDNAATTRVDPSVAEIVRDCMLESFGNPSSAHHAGITAERRIKEANRQLSRAIGDEHGSLGRILWTSGGTESDALGVLAAGRTKRGMTNVVLSELEHPAVRESAGLLNWDIRTLKANPTGTICLDDIDRVVDKDTGVLAVMLVNNELGTILPVAEAAKRAKIINPNVHVHCDAVQALGKIPVDVRALGADSVAFAAHKLHGPKGVGALWLAKTARIEPLWSGGGQQSGLRSGTENVPGIAGMGAAVALAMSDLALRHEKQGAFTQDLVRACEEAKLEFCVNAKEAPRANHILSIAFAACPAEPLLHVLESRGVLVSAGSACAERNRKPSAVLTAIKVPPNYGTLRLSFGRETTAQDMERATSILIDSVRSFQR